MLTNEILQLSLSAIKTICLALNVSANEIKEIDVLKKGMTNRSFLFSCKGEKYIMRIPGEGTDLLINRKHESIVYKTLFGKQITDDTVFIDSKTGFKISHFIDNARVCDKNDKSDVYKCMKKLKSFHKSAFKVTHTFNLFSQIEFYEKLRNEKPSCYKDYEETKECVYSLKSFINKNKTKMTLCHIDSVPDNFLFYKNKNDKMIGGTLTESLRLIDWEYAGMQDPLLDIAMFAVYSMYSEDKINELITSYFDETPSLITIILIHCYIASAGLLWSNWCEYKRTLGVEFGEYALSQYNFAKNYSKKARKEIDSLNKNSKTPKL